jgi:DNA-binding SARP family transcriptional activator/tetratricopeptide (TPR) repeat protein
VLRLFTFGGIGIEPDDGSTAPRLRPPRLALLAVIAAAGDRGVSRERLASLFWPEADERHARHSLRQALYALRNDLNREVVRSAGASLALDEAEISADVTEFRSALAAGDHARAVGIVRGPFLDGFYLPGAPAFERWVEEERARVSASCINALLSLASDAARTNDRDAVVEWWRQLTSADPLSGRFALGYLKALAARGDRVEALAFARQHEALVRRELEADPNPDIRRLEAELRAMSAPNIPRVAADVVSTPVSTPSSQSGPEPETLVSTPPALPRRSPRPRLQRRAVLAIGAVSVLALSVMPAFRPTGATDAPPVIAVGFIAEGAVPDSMRGGRVLTDMLATNLSRIDGLAVLSNSRVLALLRPGIDSAATYADAARRAGASELLEGRLLEAPTAAAALEVRRVELRTGIVRDVYRVSALDHHGLVDSLTRAVAQRFRLHSPRTSIASASTSSPVAYSLYEEGLRAYNQLDEKTAQRLMRAALEEDSTFAMAAYYEALMTPNGTLPDGRHALDVVRNALHLASRAPDRERLTITANLLSLHTDPRALAVAESLASRYPNDPRTLTSLEKARWWAGDWAGAVAALERAIVLDSIGGHKGSMICFLCRDFAELGEVYVWWDSLPAAIRTAKRYLAAVPETLDPFYNWTLAAARLGDGVAADSAFRRISSRGGNDRHLRLRLDLTLERYDDVEQGARPLLASSWLGEWGVGAWDYLIALRNQGRLREAAQFHRDGTLPGFPPAFVGRPQDLFNEGILAFERGDARAAARVFGDRLRADMSWSMPGVQARHLAWTGTLRGMALAAAGDTATVLALADSVEEWGRRSAYGRDRKAHHYLRGLVLAAAGRHEDAAREFRAAIHSPTLGFTRVNFELARCLLRLGRPQEAVSTLQSALRGEVDASNLYITRTELHELLAQSFAAAGQVDSAAAHYRAVTKAWQRADPSFYNRRDRARAWLARHLKASSQISN